MNQKQYRDWLGGVNPRIENQWNIQQQYRQQMQQQNAQEPQQHQQQWQQQQRDHQNTGQQCYHQQCNRQHGSGKQHQMFNCNQQQNQSLAQPPHENFQNAYHQMDGEQMNKRKKLFENLVYIPEKQFPNQHPQQHGQNRNCCQQENPGFEHPVPGSGLDNQQAVRPQPYSHAPLPLPDEFRHNPRPRGFLPRANFFLRASRPTQHLARQYPPHGPFHQGPQFPFHGVHPNMASYPMNPQGQFLMPGGYYQNWPAPYGGYGYPPSFQPEAELPHHLQNQDHRDYQFPHGRYAGGPQFEGMPQNPQGQPMPGNDNCRGTCGGNNSQQPQVNRVSCSGDVEIKTKKTPNFFSITQKNPMRQMKELDEVLDLMNPPRPSENRLCTVRNEICQEKNSDGKLKFGPEQLLMPNIIRKRNNQREWRVELYCPGWQNAFLQVELQEEHSSSTEGRKKNWIYVRGKRDVQTEAGSVLVKFEKKIEAPLSVDRTFVRAEMTKKGKLAIIADKKQRGKFRGAY